jgi:hypothetical protein
MEERAQANRHVTPQRLWYQSIHTELLGKDHEYPEVSVEDCPPGAKLELHKKSKEALFSPNSAPDVMQLRRIKGQDDPTWPTATPESSGRRPGAMAVLRECAETQEWGLVANSWLIKLAIVGTVVRKVAEPDKIYFVMGKCWKQAVILWMAICVVVSDTCFYRPLLAPEPNAPPVSLASIMNTALWEARPVRWMAPAEALVKLRRSLRVKPPAKAGGWAIATHPWGTLERAGALECFPDMSLAELRDVAGYFGWVIVGAVTLFDVLVKMVAAALPEMGEDAIADLVIARLDKLRQGYGGDILEVKGLEDIFDKSDWKVMQSEKEERKKRKEALGTFEKDAKKWVRAARKRSAEKKEQERKEREGGGAAAGGRRKRKAGELDPPAEPEFRKIAKPPGDDDPTEATVQRYLPPTWRVWQDSSGCFPGKGLSFREGCPTDS